MANASCKSCGRPFEPAKPYHRYCDACYADIQAERRSRTPFLERRYPRYFPNPQLLLVSGALGLIGLLIYAVGRVFGLW